MTPRGQVAPIRVVFVDDDPGLCQLVKILLGWEPDIELIGVATNGTEGVKLASELEPDLVVCDLRLPDISGVEVGNQIAKRSPASRLVLISGHDAEDITEELKMNVFTYVDKKLAFRDFPALVRRVAG